MACPCHDVIWTDEEIAVSDRVYAMAPHSAVKTGRNRHGVWLYKARVRDLSGHTFVVDLRRVHALKPGWSVVTPWVEE